MQPRHNVVPFRFRDNATADSGTYKLLGQKIAKARKKAGLLQRQFGELMGMDRSVMWEVEAGNRRIDIFELKDMVDYLAEHEPEFAPLKEVLGACFNFGDHKVSYFPYRQLGKLIIETREYRITQTKLAADSGLPRMTLSRIESGKRRVYFIDLWAIAHNLRGYSIPFRKLDNALRSLLLEEAVASRPSPTPSEPVTARIYQFPQVA